ncbi:MAG TPA: hypothetical protein DCS93_42030 [Microscillaceae bacterium]|nr:hypothetical protein [Microscillaceae bacterium]
MSEVTNNLTNVPLGYIVGAPLQSAVEAQSLAAEATVEFIRQVGFKPSDPNSDAGLIDDISADTDLGSMRQVVFKYTRTEGGTTDATETIELRMPILSIVPIPYLRIAEIETDFTLKITETNSTVNQSQTGSVGRNSRTIGWGNSYYNFKASYARQTKTSSEDKYYLENRATMNVRIKAIQDEAPRGLTRILDIMENSIEQTISTND